MCVRRKKRKREMEKAALCIYIFHPQNPRKATSFTNKHIFIIARRFLPEQREGNKKTTSSRKTRIRLRRILIFPILSVPSLTLPSSRSFSFSHHSLQARLQLVPLQKSRFYTHRVLFFSWFSIVFFAGSGVYEGDRHFLILIQMYLLKEPFSLHGCCNKSFSWKMTNWQTEFNCYCNTSAPYLEASEQYSIL